MNNIIAYISVDNYTFNPELAFERFVSGINRADYSVYYAGIKNWSLYSKHSLSDERTTRLLDYLKSLGVEPARSGKTGTFGYSLRRVYEPSDFKDVVLFEPHPVGHVGLLIRRSDEGRLKLKKSHLRLQNYMGKANWPWLVVSDDMRKKLERAGFQRLVFKETEAGGNVLKDETNQIWELDSSLQLPPVSSKCDVRYQDGTPFTGDYDRACKVVEGFYIKPEYHYTRAAIESVGEFDLARICERYAPAPGYLVCSRRFYEFCQAHKVKMEWYPVWIDPDDS